ADLMIATGGVETLAIPFHERPQFEPQEPGLNGIQSAVIPLQFVIILLRLAMIAQHSDSFRDCFVVGGHCARFSARPEILSWVKAEGSRSAHGTSFSPPVLFSGKILRAVSLASVFDDDQAVLLCELENAIQVRVLAVQLHWNDGCDSPSCVLVQQSSSRA